MTDRAVARAGVIIAILSVLAKSTALLREAVIASTYGRGPEVDAFFVALALPVFLLSLVAGSFQIAVVPELLAVQRVGGREAANRLISRGAVAMLGVLTLAAIALAALAPLYIPAIASGLSDRAVDLVIEMLWVMILFASIGGVALAAGAYLNAERRFALPAAAPAVTPVVMTMALVFAGERVGVTALAWGAGLGTAIEAALVLAAARRLGYRFTLATGESWHRLLRRWQPVMLASLLLSGAALIDQVMAASLGPGAASALGYGVKLVLAGLHVVTLALGVAVLPAYAQTALEEVDRLDDRLRRHIAFVCALSLPAMFAAWVLAEPLIAALYQRGAFTAEDIALVSDVLIAYALQLPAYAAVVILIRAAAVLNRGGLLAVAAVTNLVLTIGLNALFMTLWGVVGIALATTPAFIVTAGVLYAGTVRISGHRQ